MANTPNNKKESNTAISDTANSIFRPYMPIDTERKKIVWKDGAIVFDTNIFLGLYSYSQETRNDLLKIIRSQVNKLFLPRRVFDEFIKNRAKTLEGILKEYETDIQSISTIVNKVNNSKKIPHVDDNIAKEFEKYASKIKEEINSAKKIPQEIISIQDPVMDVLSLIPTDNIGKPYTEEMVSNIISEGKERYKLKYPPGYKDENKDRELESIEPFGDFCIWKELLEANKDIIFVTEDLKEDWWFKFKGDAIAMRPFLIREFIAKTGKEIILYNLTEFLKEANLYIGNDFEVSNESLKEIDYTRIYFSDLKIITKDILLDNIKSFVAENGLYGSYYIPLVKFVKEYLGPKGFHYKSTWELIEELHQKGDSIKMSVRNNEYGDFKVIELLNQ